MPFIHRKLDAGESGAPRELQGDTAPKPASRGRQTPSGFAVQLPEAVLTEASESALLASAYAQFNDMTVTKYAHHFTTEPPDLYFYDCVGFAGYTLRKATPTAWNSLATAIGLKHGFVPKPITFTHFLHSLEQRPQAGWLAVPGVGDIRGGDLLTWQPASADGTPALDKVGHAVMALTRPQPLDTAGARWGLVIMDSTATQHGPNDTRRPENVLSQRNIPIVNARGVSAPSGLGIGVMGFSAAPDGRIVAVEWSLGRAPKPVVLAAGRASR
jgi:hypothetical protein